MLMIIPGKNGPVHVRKGLALITLFPGCALAAPSIYNWQDTIFQHRYYQSIWIEVPHIHRWHVYNMLPTLLLPGFVSVDRPKPSRGSRSEEMWSNLKMHFDEQIGSPLMQEVFASIKGYYFQAAPHASGTTRG